MSLLMRDSKSPYGIKVRFACKLCTINYFEAVEDYIEHKRENHFGEFEKNKCFIILEERSLSIDNNYFYDESAVDLDVKVVVASQSLPPTPSNYIPLKKERNEFDECDLKNDLLSTEGSDGVFTNISDLSETESPVQLGFTNYKYKGTDPDSVPQQFSVNDCHSATATIATNTLAQNSAEPFHQHLKTDPVIFENLVQENKTIRQKQAEDETQNKVMNIPSLKSNPSPARFSPAEPHLHLSLHCCELCLRTFNSKPALTIHGNICVLYHPKRSSYCVQCNHLFSDTDALRYHMSTFHTNKNSESEEANSVSVNDKDSDSLVQEIPEPPPPKKMKSNIDAGPTVKDNLYPRPKVPIKYLIAMALKNAKNGSLYVSQMYKFISHNFPYFETARGSCKRALRHALWKNISIFGRIDKIVNGLGVPQKGRWVVDPLMVQKLDELVYKQLDANRDNIRRAMRCPQNIDSILRGEFRGDFEDSGDDEENADLNFVTSSSEVQGGRESEEKSSSSANSFLAEPTSPICANTPYEPSQQQFSTDHNYFYASKTHFKFEPDPAVTSDFCEIMNVQGNYSR